jgi:hypothetical protein
MPVNSLKLLNDFLHSYLTMYAKEEKEERKRREKRRKKG